MQEWHIYGWLNQWTKFTLAGFQKYENTQNIHIQKNKKMLVWLNQWTKFALRGFQKWLQSLSIFSQNSYLDLNLELFFFITIFVKYLSSQRNFLFAQSLQNHDPILPPLWKWCKISHKSDSIKQIQDRITIKCDKWCTKFKTWRYN